MFMANQTIYDANGSAKLIILSNGRLVDFSGNSIGFIKSKHVYDYNGTHRGFFEGGILRDHFGCCVGFTGNATDSPHPFFPLKYLSPLPCLPSLEPLRPLTELPPLPSIKNMSWSSYNPLSLFR
jgi:hypothetical protein